MTRNRFILLLDKQLAEQFPGWKAREEELTMVDVVAIERSLQEIYDRAIGQLVQDTEVKA